MAKQEGEYLAEFFNACDADAEKLRGDSMKFEYVHKGSLAYIGGMPRWRTSRLTIVKGIADGHHLEELRLCHRCRAQHLPRRLGHDSH